VINKNCTVTITRLLIAKKLTSNIHWLICYDFVNCATNITEHFFQATSSTFIFLPVKTQDLSKTDFRLCLTKYELL